MTPLTRRLFRAALLPVIVYTSAALFITWPLAIHLTTHVAGGGFGDSFEYVRLGWWGSYALTHSLNPFYQSLLSYPDGFFSTTQWMQPLIYWPTALLGFFFSPATAFNLWLLLEIILSGLAAYALCRDVIGHVTDADGLTTTIAALIGGLIFMAFPAVQGHLSAGHVNPLSNYAIPAVVMALYRLVTGRGTRRTAIGGALALWILALGNFTFPVFVLLPIVLFGGGYWLIARDERLTRRVGGQIVVMFGLSLLLILPFYLPTIVEAFSPVRPAYLNEGGSVRYSTDPLAFVALSPFTDWTKAWVPAYSRAVLGTNSTEGTAYLGLAAVALAIVATARYRRRAGIWLAIAIGCMIFSLGPLLKWNDQPVTISVDGQASTIVLPWALFQDLPLVNLTRTPGRFNMTTGLMLGVLAALGLAFVLSRITAPGRRIGLGVVAGLFIMAEYQLFFPFPMVVAALGGEAYFRSLGARSDVRAVFDLPLDDPIAQKEALYEQTLHHKPMIAGYVSRRTSVDPAKLEILSDAAKGSLLVLEPRTATPDDFASILKDNGVDVLVIHRALMDQLHIEPGVLVSLYHAPVYEDDAMIIFETPKPAQPVKSLVGAMSEVDSWRTGDAYRWFQGGLEEYLYAPTDLSKQLTLTLVPLFKPYTVRLSIDNQARRAWTIAPPETRLTFPVDLKAGFHTLKFEIPHQTCTPVPVQPECLLDGAIHNAAGCALKADQRGMCVSLGYKFGAPNVGFDAPLPLQSASVALANGLTFTGFRMPEQVDSGATLVVDTDWHAANKLPGDYHLFIHVLDASGRPVAQADVVPGGGTYPTAEWAETQDWSEMLSISIPAGTPPGMYAIVTGWYRYPDLMRLAVEGNSPRAADGLIDLGSVTVR
ncbi:MAG TPA: hypothetical protein VMT34_09155 [Aggregatilineales bacterium]|nr:hypothetical protein [Aggregatilineales bacterium]